ncbi:MAG: dTDP-glucose 4,6-dehydratase, partial [Sphingopyxis terrae]
MAARRILVTGAAGFIGANFVRELLGADPEAFVVGLDALTYAGNLENLAGLPDDRFRFEKADIRDRDRLDALFAQDRYTHVVNFAAESHVDRSIAGPEIFVDVNVRGTLTLLEAVRRHGGARFVQIGTDEVYGSLGPEGAFTEDSPIRPSSPYSASKAGADHIALAYHVTFGMDVLVTRCSNNYGPYQFPEKLIPLMILNGLRGEPLPVYGDGKNVRDWIHVRDHARAILSVIERGRAGEVYNIGAKNEWANIDIVHLVCDIVDETRGNAPGTSRKLIRFVKDRPGHDRRYAIDSAKLAREIGHEASIDFPAGIRET